MKPLLQILLFLLTWFSNLNATTVFTKVILPIYECSSSKIKNVKEEKETKIDNFLIAWDAFYAAVDIVATLPNGAIKINLNASISKPSFKQAFTEFIQTSKNFANVSTIKTQVFINAFCRAFAQKRLIESATALKNNFALTVKPNMVAVVASANTEYNIATCNYLDYLNDVEYLFAPGKTVYNNAAQVAGYEKLVKLENVTFYTPNGKAKFGNFEVYKNTLNNEIVILDLVNEGGSKLVQSLSPVLKSIHDKLVSGGVQIFEQEKIIKYFTKNGEEIARIDNGLFSVSKTKGNIPDPSAYLDGSYITNHVNKFNQEGGAFVIRKSDLSNPNYTSLAPRKFIGLKSEMDAVIIKYNNSGKNPQILIDELDLGDNYFNRPNDEIYFVTVEPNKGFNFDLPTGNEGGAYEGFWVPGGYTKHGTAEAVISNSANLQHNNSIQIFKNIFGVNNVVKIN